jgi:hypothetical protein
MLHRSNPLRDTLIRLDSTHQTLRQTPPPSELSAEITNTDRVGNYVEYELTVSGLPVGSRLPPYKIVKRYRDFTDLHAQLTRRPRNGELQHGYPQGVLTTVKLPPKVGLGSYRVDTTIQIPPTPLTPPTTPRPFHLTDHSPPRSSLWSIPLI